MTPLSASPVASGIAPLDQRVGGLESGGTYLVIGAPGPAKMVAVLQFLHEGVRNGERCLLVSNGDVVDILAVARAWGFELAPAWESGLLQIIGFRDDFELRAIRSIAPEEVLEELAAIVVEVPSRIAVDPGSRFLTGGARTLLSAAFVSWAKQQPGTVLTTFSVDGDATELPSSADWLLSGTTALLILNRRGEALYQLQLSKPVPRAGERGETVTLELKPGVGLVQPERFPTRRDADRGDVDRNRLLLVSLGDGHGSDIEAWASRSFDAELVSEPFEAVARVQGPDARYGCVLLHADRRHVRQAVQACRALRPLTRAAIVFASDDTIRSSDRIHILEAGADDCLNGGLDFRELALRIKQAIASGARPSLPQAARTHSAEIVSPESVGGRVSRPVFAREVARRADDPDLAFFCVLEVSAERKTASTLEDGLVGLVRSEEGDLVAAGDAGRCLVLLQGAREAQLGPFVARLRNRLAESANGEKGLEVTVLSHPVDGARIRSLLGSTGGEGG